MSTKFHLGPILALTNATPEKWSISILVVVDETLQPTCSWELDGGVATPIAGRSDFGLSGKKIVYFAF